MNNRAKKSNDVIEVDLRKIGRALLHKAWLIVLIAVLCAIISVVVTYNFVTPQYQSSAMFYVNNSSISVGEASLSISSADITASKSLVESYIVILKTRTTLDDVIDYAGVNRSYSELRNMISAADVNETEIFEIVVTSPDPQEAERIANAITYILPKRISSIIEGSSAKIVDTAVVPSQPSTPSYPQNIFMGFLVGMLLTMTVIVIKQLTDVTIRTEEDIAYVSQYPILAAVPDMGGQSKPGYYYGNAPDKKDKKTQSKNADHIGDGIPFAAAEAYKLLRTKIRFSFADGNKCHVIGISSALSGEGKSTTSINLAHALAQLDKKILLIDCDLRRPSVAARLRCSLEPGLSDFLTNQADSNAIVQTCRMKNNAEFAVISAGRIPPNPMELLSSPRMEQSIERLRELFDYIILDLPPVEEVGDALVASKLTDGILVVVRQNYCNRVALDDSIHQFEFVEGKILGFLMTYTTENGAGYGKKYYKKYYKRYGKYYKYADSREQGKRDDRQGVSKK